MLDTIEATPRMFTSKTFPWARWTVLATLLIGLSTGERSSAATAPPPASETALAPSTNQRIGFDEFVDLAVRQEHDLTDFIGKISPIIETYIQEEGSQYRFQQGIIPNGDDYFLGRLNLSDQTLSTEPFADEETWYRGAEKYFVQDPAPFTQAAFAQALFPDFGHFDRQNYTFEFVRWEVLGEVRCAAIDVKPNRNHKNRGFLGRIWVEDRNQGIVRFQGTFTSNRLAKRAFHFDSWRLNTMANWWMPAYVYTEETKPFDVSNHKPWFKAQTRVWGYDLRNAVTPMEKAKETNAPEDFPILSPDKETDSLENTVVRKSEAAGLMAPDGGVNRILEVVANNILITNNLDLAGLRCRVLLTTPLETFVVGRTIVVSRGLLDVLPDEATLAAVLAHELAHVILGHAPDSTAFAVSSSFPDSQVFGALDFHFNRTQEAEATRKGIELFSKSPYKDQYATAALFLKAMEASTGRFPILLHGRFGNDFGSSRLAGVNRKAGTSKVSKTDRLDQIPALPIGSRVVVDPWSDRIEMLKSRPVRLLSKSEKIPFEVTPFYPHLRRLDALDKTRSERR